MQRIQKQEEVSVVPVHSCLMRFLESIGLKLALPIVFELDNQVAVDLVNKYSVGG